MSLENAISENTSAINALIVILKQNHIAPTSDVVSQATKIATAATYAEAKGGEVEEKPKAKATKPRAKKAAPVKTAMEDAREQHSKDKLERQDAEKKSTDVLDKKEVSAKAPAKKEIEREELRALLMRVSKTLDLKSAYEILEEFSVKTVPQLKPPQFEAFKKSCLEALGE